MDEILQMLYEGRIHPQETNMHASAKWNEAKLRYQNLKEKTLTEADDVKCEAIEELLEERNALLAIEIEDAYIRGMRMGAKLTAALLGDKKTSQP